MRTTCRTARSAPGKASRCGRDGPVPSKQAPPSGLNGGAMPGDRVDLDPVTATPSTDRVSKWSYHRHLRIQARLDCRCLSVGSLKEFTNYRPVVRNLPCYRARKLCTFPLSPTRRQEGRPLPSRRKRDLFFSPKVAFPASRRERSEAGAGFSHGKKQPPHASDLPAVAGPARGEYVRGPLQAPTSGP